MNIFAIRTGDKYGLEYESYLRDKLPGITILNNPFPDYIHQWNKIHFFNVKSNGPVVVIDIDVELINDYMEMFEYPVERGEFLTLDPWWDTNRVSCGINGAFYKFWPEDTKYIRDEFNRDQAYWRHYFIKNGTKPGPVNGEENFVELMVKKRLELKFLPHAWYTRMEENPTKEDLVRLNRKYPGEYLILDQYHPQVKMIHYNGIHRGNALPLV